MFYGAKNVYALCAVLGPRLDTVGVWGSNPHAPTNLSNNLVRTTKFSVDPKRLTELSAPPRASVVDRQSFAIFAKQRVECEELGSSVIQTRPEFKLGFYAEIGLP